MIHLIFNEKGHPQGWPFSLAETCFLLPPEGEAWGFFT
jgi:hypothetical protein